MPNYQAFLESKSQYGIDEGFNPVDLPSFLYPFQVDLTTWALRRGRAAIFADCGLGKTPMQLVWADQVRRHENKPVLIVTPLAVGHQTIKEGTKFGIECHRSQDGTPRSPITVTNYERLHLFNPQDYSGVVCDESSILKNFDGRRKAVVTEFMRTLPYRLLCTATAAPNDYIELGTSSEALGHMGHMDMLGMFFKNTQGSIDIKRSWRMHGGSAPQWRFKRHAESNFWRWVCSWARALRKPSDLGYSDDGFILPELIERETVVNASRPLDGYLFPVPAGNLQEQREERRETITERCERVAEMVKHDRPAVVWCHLNAEGDLLEKLIPDAVQVSGADSDDKKEESFIGFSDGSIRVIITKPRIGAFGLNWQHCNHVTFFPSHSYEQYYQGVRRCWRFGQTKPVTVDIVTTEGEKEVLENLQRKSKAADTMFTELTRHMVNELTIKRDNSYTKKEEVPSWL